MCVFSDVHNNWCSRCCYSRHLTTRKLRQREELQLTHGCTVGKLAACWAVSALGCILLCRKIMLSILGSLDSATLHQGQVPMTSLSLKGVIPASLGVVSKHQALRSRPWNCPEVALAGGFQSPGLLRASWGGHPLLALGSGSPAAKVRLSTGTSSSSEGPAWGRKDWRL